MSGKIPIFQRIDNRYIFFYLHILVQNQHTPLVTMIIRSTVIMVSSSSHTQKLIHKSVACTPETRNKRIDLCRKHLLFINYPASSPLHCQCHSLSLGNPSLCIILRDGTHLSLWQQKQQCPLLLSLLQQNQIRFLRYSSPRL